MNAAIYTRVSTADQNSELQFRELQEYAKRQDRLMEDARASKFDCLMVWTLDRFGRSLVDSLNNIRELERCRVRFIAVTQNLDTDEKNPASRFLLQVLGAVEEFERSLIRERTQAGQHRYRADYVAGKVGKTVYSRSGKNLPPHRPKRIFNRDAVATLRAQGLSIRAIAARLELGVGSRDCGQDVAGAFQTAVNGALEQRAAWNCPVAQHGVRQTPIRSKIDFRVGSLQ